MVHFFSLSILALSFTVFNCHSCDIKLVILAGKRRREKKDQKPRSQTKLSQNLMETFIPWGIRSAFCRGKFPRITELTVPCWETTKCSPFVTDIFGCSSCGVAFCRTKGSWLFLLLDRYLYFLMCLQMYSFSLLVWEYMKGYVGINVTHKQRNIAFSLVF